MNLPNKITVARIALIPFMIVFFFLDFLPYHLNVILATLLFCLAAFTDFLDGHIARSRNLVTDLGKFLDPIADKVLVVVTLFLLVEQQMIPFIFGSVLSGIILSRELIVGAFRQIAAAKNVVLAADKLGKIKTVITNISLPFLIMKPVFYKYNVKFMFYIGFALFVLATIMTIISGVNYLYKNRKLLNTK